MPSTAPPEVPRADRRLELETTVGLVGDEAERVRDAAAREHRRERERRDERSAPPITVKPAPDGDHRRREQRCRPHLDPGRDGQEDRAQPRSADEPQTARDRERNRDPVEPVHSDRTEERDEREPEPRGGDRARATGRGPTSIANASASHSVIRIAHATSYPAIQAKPWASTIGTRASCGYTHDSVTPTIAATLDRPRRPRFVDEVHVAHRLIGLHEPEARRRGRARPRTRSTALPASTPVDSRARPVSRRLPTRRRGVSEPRAPRRRRAGAPRPHPAR